MAHVHQDQDGGAGTRSHDLMVIDDRSIRNRETEVWDFGYVFADEKYGCNSGNSIRKDCRREPTKIKMRARLPRLADWAFFTTVARAESMLDCFRSVQWMCLDY